MAECAPVLMTSMELASKTKTCWRFLEWRPMLGDDVASGHGCMKPGSVQYLTVLGCGRLRTRSLDQVAAESAIYISSCTCFNTDLQSQPDCPPSFNEKRLQNRCTQDIVLINCLSTIPRCRSGTVVLAGFMKNSLRNN